MNGPCINKYLVSSFCIVQKKLILLSKSKLPSSQDPLSERFSNSCSGDGKTGITVASSQQLP